MNGGHDLGGMHGLGPIAHEPEASEPVFHASWERRVFGMVRVLGPLGIWTGDMSRHARERQHPVDYLRHTYYENWLAGLEKLLVETGLVTPAELETGKSAALATQELRERVVSPASIARALEPSPAARSIDAAPRFRPGDRVRAVNRHILGHTRLPRYVRGREGVIHANHGGHIFPDLSARGVQAAQHLYGVRFEARALWGEDASARDVVFIDLWEEYLEPA